MEHKSALEAIANMQTDENTNYEELCALCKVIASVTLNKDQCPIQEQGDCKGCEVTPSYQCPLKS